MTDETKFDHQGRIIRAEIETTATPQQAWEAWADPEKIAHWFVDRASGEAKPGGTMTWFFDEFGFALPYKVVEATPGKLFVLKWEAPQGGPTGILEVKIARRGGATRIQLVNSGFREDAAWNDEYEGVVSGWKMSLAILKYYLENHFGSAKAALLVMRPATFTYEQLHEYFVDSTKLALWLANSGAIGKIGDACRLELRDGGTLTGRILADTGREVTVSWEEIGGTLELKGFSMGPQRVAGVRCMVWNPKPERMERLKTDLSAAVERLAALLPAATAAGASGAIPSRATPFEDKP
ncbi:MAG: SRPBCC domain-containing protein [Candidatus Acidiferrales bacterium]